MKGIIDEIREKTGIVLDVRDACPRDEAFSQTDGKTRFLFRYGDQTFLGTIEGEGKTQENYAFFLSRFLEASLPPADVSKEGALKAMLLGDASKSDVKKYALKYKLPDDAPCFALAIRAKERLAEVTAYLSLCKNLPCDAIVAMEECSCAFLVFAEEDVSAREYALYLEQSLREELGIGVTIGVGDRVGSIFDVNRSYRQAYSALRFSTLLKDKGGVHTYREYTLVKLLEELPVQALKERKEELSCGMEDEVFGDEELLETAEAFLQNSLNVAETARTLFLHRNTLLYRLDKIEKCTGLNIRKFSDAVSFRILTILYRLINR
ncbi:MAG: helix-turn-helix domain-containing protein [Clostridia bacterium]|nr:helix-turn-helix domain-containing protein [Clostridia bacterium]